MKKIFQTIYSLFCWTVSFLMMIIIGYGFMIPVAFFLKDKKPFYHNGTRFWARVLMRLGMVKIMVEGKENITAGKNYIFASNHASLTDIYILAIAVPIRFLFVMDEDLFKVPFMGGYCRHAGYLPISRRTPRKALIDLKRVVENIRHGESVVFFPEGGRSSDGRLGPFKSGLGKIVRYSDASVIPVAICGSANIMPRKSFTISPGNVRVKFGKPLRFSVTQGDIEISEQVHHEVAEIMKQLEGE